MQPVVHAEDPQTLALEFAPVLHFTGGEKFYPTSVDYVIGSSVLKRRNLDGSSTLVDSNPTAKIGRAACRERV